MQASVLDSLMDGLVLLVVGMTTVYAFLLALVGVLFATAWLAARLAPAEPPTSITGPASGRDVEGERRRAAASAAALGHYRRRHGG